MNNILFLFGTCATINKIEKVCLTTSLLYFICKMDSTFVHSYVTNELFAAAGLNFRLADVKDINSMIGNKTIIMILYKLSFAIRYGTHWKKLISSEFIKKYDRNKTLGNTLLKNVRILLFHPDIDYSVGPNSKVLEIAILGGHLSLKNDEIDELLGRHRLNPDVVMGQNSVARLLGTDFRTDTEKIILFLKYGADVDLDVQNSLYNMPYYVAASKNLVILDMIVTHTKCFRHAETMFRKDTIRDIDFDTVARLFDSILRCGKLTAFENLNKNIINFDRWLRNIRSCTELDMQTMRQCVDIPMDYFHLICGHKKADNSLRKLILFKHNLECMTQRTIIVPAYKYYDVAIIFLFLMRNRHLTVLTCDVLRYIVALVFS